MIKIKIANKHILPVNIDTLKKGSIYKYNKEFYIITSVGSEIYMINLETGIALFVIGPVDVYVKEVKSATLIINKE